jgi:hypothetical protein
MTATPNVGTMSYNSMAQAQVQPQVQAQPTAPQLIKENTVNVSGDNPTAVISDILSKFKIPQ